MRDLRKDLETCNQATPGPWWIVRKAEGILIAGHNHAENFQDCDFIAQAREGWPHAIERAIKAEAEVERLRMALDKIANPLKYIQMEARAKGAELNGVYAIMLSKDPSYLQEIAIAELDKDKGD